jgi:hypothetical protein
MPDSQKPVRIERSISSRKSTSMVRCADDQEAGGLKRRSPNATCGDERVDPHGCLTNGRLRVRVRGCEVARVRGCEGEKVRGWEDERMRRCEVRG